MIILWLTGFNDWFHFEEHFIKNRNTATLLNQSC